MLVVNYQKLRIFQCLNRKRRGLLEYKTLVGGGQAVLGTKARGRLFGFIVDVKSAQTAFVYKSNLLAHLTLPHKKIAFL